MTCRSGWRGPPEKFLGGTCPIGSPAFVEGVRAGPRRGRPTDDRRAIPMAQYLMSVLDETAGLATAEEMAAIDAFNEQELMAKGHWVFAGGLASPGSATVVDARHGEPVFTDGPYLESKEYV